MSRELIPEQLEALRAYAAGRRGTRDTIDRAGMLYLEPPVLSKHPAGTVLSA